MTKKINKNHFHFNVSSFKECANRYSKYLIGQQKQYCQKEFHQDQVIYNSSIASVSVIKPKNCLILGALLIVPSFLTGNTIFQVGQKSSFCHKMTDNNQIIFLIHWKMNENINNPSLGLSHLIQEIIKIAKFLKQKNFYDISEYRIKDKKRIKLHIFGYCLGGTLAVAAKNHLKWVSGLVLLATPWNFHLINGPKNALWKSSFSSNHNCVRNPNLDSDKVLFTLLKIVEKIGYVPASILSTSFFLLYPEKIMSKVVNFTKQPLVEQTSAMGAYDKSFWQIESWLNSYNNLPKTIYKSLLQDLFINNLAFKGEWKINKKFVSLGDLGRVLYINPLLDNVVNPASSTDFSKIDSDFEQLNIKDGHIGFFVKYILNKERYNYIACWLNNFIKG